MKMENNNNNDTVQDDDFGCEAEMTSAPIGQQLKERREQLGITKLEVAEHLCLKESVVEKMEAQIFEEHDMTIFIRGYFRSYAKMLDMDEESVLKALESEQLPPATVQKMTSFSRKNQQKKHESRVMLVTWVIVFIVIGITAFWWWQNSKNDYVAVTEEPVSTQVQEPIVIEDYQPPGESIEIPLDISESTNESLNETAPATENDAINQVEEEPTDDMPMGNTSMDSMESAPSSTSSNSNASENTQPVVENELTEIEKLEPPQLDLSSEEESEPVEEAKEVAPNTIVLTFTQENDIEVRNRTTRILFKGDPKSIGRLEYTEAMPYYLAFDTPAGVKITLGGKEIDLSSYPDGQYFQLKLSK